MSAGALRIGFVLGLDWTAPGGVQSVTRGLARELMGLGQRVMVLAFAGAEEGPREFLDGGAEMQLLRAPGPVPDWGALNARVDLEEQVLRWSANHELDVVHVQHPSGFGVRLPRLLRDARRTVFATLHDDGWVCPRGQMWSVAGESCETVEPQTCASCWAQTWPQAGTGDAAHSAVEERLREARDSLAACAQVFVPSSAACDVALKWGAPAHKLVVRPNALREPRRSPTRRRFDSQDVRVGILGSVQPSKGCAFLARVIAELGAPFQLDLHGACADYHGDRRHLEILERFSFESGRVHLRGAYEPSELPDILANLDLVCVPSLWHEVHGLVAREALLAGVPVFVAARGGLLDVPALQLPAGDPTAWGEALTRFASDADWRAEQVAKRPRSPSSADYARTHLDAYRAAL